MTLKMGVGIATYNEYRRFDNLISTIERHTETHERGKDYDLVVVDDGSYKKDVLESTRKICKDRNVPLIEHGKNRGIPAAWNSLTKFYDCDIMVIFNDDMEVCDPNWLKYMEFFFDNNEHVGVAGWPLIQHNMQTGVEDPPSIAEGRKRWGDKPGVVGAPVGCCFAFRKKTWAQIKNLDGSIGFWEDLISFHEESSFGFEHCRMGYTNYMLPYPPMRVMGGGQTFATNPQISLRKPGEYLSLDEYKGIMLQQFPMDGGGTRCPIANAFGEVQRMDYGRCLFAKYWGCKDYWFDSMIEVHRKHVDPLPARKVKWLNEKLEVCEAIDK